ncbi:MAG: UvrD-helicase domain-containing protein, partial [Myxococcota bacterium]
ARLFRISELLHRTLKARAGETPQHPFFDLCDAWLGAADDLEEAYRSQWVALELAFLAYAEVEIDARREERSTRSFGDLLVDLAEALDGPSGERLESRIRSRFPAAMIDEFQDTDPVQYHIFDRIWGGGKGSFFLIGDPKQAIYSFRGADIFAYMRAKRDARDAQYTLDLNWRSDPSVIRAVNSVFERIPSPFLFDDIPFHSAQAPTTARECMGPEAGAALRLLVFGRDDEGRLRKLGRTREMATSATAADIARLLNSGASLDVEPGEPAPVQPGDVAVLCRTGPQARAIREALARLGIASVMTGQESVFETEEALEFEWLLSAVAQPGDLRALRTALCTRLLGANAETLFDLQQDPDGWEPWLERARDWQVAWNRGGPIGLLDRVLSRGNVRAQMLARPDGERRLTNWLHLGELLQQVWQRGRVGPSALHAWLGHLRRNLRSRRAQSDDDALIRLESDERAVKLVTLHSSTGLQYPIVYCPFLWDARTRRTVEQTWTAFHDPDQEDRLTLDIGRDAAHQRAVGRAAWEALAEDLRLLYVGLTRAQHRLVVIWGSVENAGSSALGLLLHPPADLDVWRETWDEDPAKRLRENFKGIEDPEILAELQRLAEASDGAIGVEALVEAPGPQRVPEWTEGVELRARVATRSLQSAWRISSFSGLVAGFDASRVENHPRTLGFDHEDPAGAQTLPSLSSDEGLRVRLADFPAGAVPGTMMHDVLERLDFQQREPEVLGEIVAAALARHGLAERWALSLCQAVPEILATPLGGPLEDFALQDLSRVDRIDELEFTLPVAGPGRTPVSPTELAQAFATQAVRPSVIDYAARASTLGFSPLEGHLRGFVDLVFRHDGRFYLADYKSNRLGFVGSDYGPEAVERAMLEHDYVRQYRRYMLALHRMLPIRCPGYDYESHMGGVYYLFLRGLGPDSPTGAGLFFDRPPASLVEALSECMGGDGSGIKGGGA